jgi:hypothetical protein
VNRPIALTPFRHSALFVAGAGDPGSSEILAQYSLQGNATEFDPQGSQSYTSRTDRQAFRNPGGENFFFPITPPLGMTPKEFADHMILLNTNYRALAYRRFAGPNSNSAAAFAPFQTGAAVPPIPWTPALDYYDPSRRNP